MARSSGRWSLIRVVALGVVLGAAGACGDDDDSAPGTTAPAETPGTTAPAETPETEGCTGPAPGFPNGVASGRIVDVDGDGREDTAWLAAGGEGSREMGVSTAAGGGDTVLVSSASPVPLALLVVDVDEQPPVELLVSDNRMVQLWAFADCSLEPVIGPDGEPYRFDLGFTGAGTGVGCVDADGDGRCELVGLNATDSDDTTVRWSRTVVRLDGLQATHGATETGSFRRGEDDAAIDLLHQVTCGDLTMADDAIRQPQP